MTLTLSVSGGFTGLQKQHSINTDSLDASTRNALMTYISKASRNSTSGNITESWSVDNEREVHIDIHQLSPDLKSLYEEMKKNLRHQKK
jgi:hypothetical protein